MSKVRLAQSSRPGRTLVLILLVVTVVTVAVASIYYIQANESSLDVAKRQQRAKDVYAQIVLPKNLELRDSKALYPFVDNFDPVGYSYDYYFTGDPSQTYQALQQSLKNAQLTITDLREPNTVSNQTSDYSIGATDQSKFVSFSVLIYVKEKRVAIVADAL